MMFFGLHSWRGESGRRYMFKSVLTKHGLPEDSGGIYIFVRRRWAFFLEPLYVGKAANLRDRVLGHEKWGSAWWLHGATEQHVKQIKSEAERRVVEEDLIRALRPKMNDVHIPRGLADAPNSEQLRKIWDWKRMFMRRDAQA